MKIALDTNVLIDAIAGREGHEVAQKLIMAIATDQAEGIVAASSITDIYYITRKYIGDDAARNAIWNILTVFDVAPVNGEDCAAALCTPMADFEDAVLAVCAQKAGAKYIATRDEGFIKSESPVPAVRPQELLSKIEQRHS